jgi:hypothetical protein
MLDDIKLLLGITDASKDDLIDLYISMVAKVILNIMYPYGIPVLVTDVPEKYESVQIDMVVFKYNTQGVEGQSTHKENGTDRTYVRGGYYPTDLTSQILTLAVTTTGSTE